MTKGKCCVLYPEKICLRINYIRNEKSDDAVERNARTHNSRKSSSRTLVSFSKERKKKK